MIENNSIVDMVDHFAVMVDDNDLFAAPINIRAFNQINRMGIRNNQKGFVHDQIYSRFRKANHILFFVFNQTAH